MSFLSHHAVPSSRARHGAVLVWLILGLITLCLAVMVFLAPELPRRQLGLPEAPAERGEEPLVRNGKPAATSTTSAAPAPARTATAPSASTAVPVGTVATPVASVVAADAASVDQPVAAAVPTETATAAAPAEAAAVVVAEPVAAPSKASVDISAPDALLEQGRALCLKAEKAGSSTLANGLYDQALIPLRKAKAQFVTLIAAHPEDQVLKERLTACGELIYTANKNKSYQQK